ncbi:MAG: hypothetical protein KFF73_15750 [Cyclobacteriaceae bacterium]|nr:hypothetical protein [Cyclobacteriaceae bacterium]
MVHWFAGLLAEKWKSGEVETWRSGDVPACLQAGIRGFFSRQPVNPHYFLCVLAFRLQASGFRPPFSSFEPALSTDMLPALLSRQPFTGSTFVSIFIFIA